MHWIWVIWTSGLHSWGRIITVKTSVGQPCPGRMGSNAKNFRGHIRWWGPPATVTPDRARWGVFSVRPWLFPQGPLCLWHPRMNVQPTTMHSQHCCLSSPIWRPKSFHMGSLSARDLFPWLRRTQPCLQPPGPRDRSPLSAIFGACPRNRSIETIYAPGLTLEWSLTQGPDLANFYSAVLNLPWITKLSNESLILGLSV